MKTDAPNPPPPVFSTSANVLMGHHLQIVPWTPKTPASTNCPTQCTGTRFTYAVPRPWTFDFPEAPHLGRALRFAHPKTNPEKEAKA